MIETDAMDRRILSALAAEGRLSNVDLAARVGLSPSACLRRHQRLEEAGLIKGYRAVIDRRASGIGMLAFVMVGLSGHLRKDAEAFERAMAVCPEVRECHNITGQVEYLLRVEVTDLDAYKRFHSEVLGALAQVRSINTYVCLSSPKDLRE